MAKEKYDMKVKGGQGGNYFVSSEAIADKEYEIHIDEYRQEHTCNCIAFKMGKRNPCKHIIKVLEEREKGIYSTD